MSKRVTIKDVAREAGVTHTTVSRVIHNDGRISEETRKRVNRALTSLNYQPNMVARGLVRNRSQSIALITPDLDPYALPIVRSISEGCEAKDYAVMLFPTNTWQHEDLSFAWVAQNWLVDGIILYNLVYYDSLPKEVDVLKSGNLPFVFINKFINEPSINAVGIDNEASVHLAMEHLVELGHKRIGFLQGDLTSQDGMERFLAYQSALTKLGLSYDESIIDQGHWYDEEGYNAAKRILSQPDRPTAIYSSNDLMAIGALRAARELGLNVPKDLSIAGYDDLEAGRFVDTPLTTIKPPLAEVGKQAVELLMQALEHPTQEPKQICLEAELIVRASTGPAPRP